MSLNEGRTVRVDFDQSQVNRWIAARDQMWVEGAIELPPSVRDPQIRFLSPSRICIAMCIDLGYISPIAQADFDFHTADDDVVLSCTGLRVGGLELPLSLFATAAERVVRAEDIASARVIGTELRCKNQFVWRNGNRRYRIQEITIADGSLRVALEPLAPRSKR